MCACGGLWSIQRMWGWRTISLRVHVQRDSAPHACAHRHPAACLQDVRVVEAAVPVATDPQDVILRVTSTAICGSDLHLYTGELRVPPWGGCCPAAEAPYPPRHATPRPCPAQGRCRA